MQLIANKLSLYSQSEEINLKIYEYYSKLLFSLSGLLRNFPFAQNLFVNKYGGIEVFSNLIKLTNSAKLKAKMLTIINDMIQEQVNLV